MPDANSPKDITRTTLAVLFVSALIVSTFLIVRPFLTAFLWATMIVISTWPLLLKLQATLWGKRGLATTCMIVALLLLLVIPLAWSVGALIGNIDKIAAFADTLAHRSIPPLPDWLTGIPVVGSKLSTSWQRIQSEGLAAQVSPYAGRILNSFAASIGSVGAMLFQFLLTVIIAGVLYMNGESVARGVRAFAYRLAGQSGENAAILAGNSVRGVAVGVVVTAIAQTAIAGFGLIISSVPGASIITAGVLVFCLAQLGPLLLMLPAVGWTYHTRGGVWAGVLLVVSLLAGTIDNFLRPVLIRKGADLPLVLILLGVIGGLISLGVMGIFVGPVILAVSFVLLKEWVSERPKSDALTVRLVPRDQP
jgi:predicted PurR-regulated permease PerM